jgi:hypothetical protein
MVNRLPMTFAFHLQGPPGERLSASTSVTIRVLDENDNYPQFSQRTYYVQVSLKGHTIYVRLQKQGADPPPPSRRRNGR